MPSPLAETPPVSSVPVPTSLAGERRSRVLAAGIALLPIALALWLAFSRGGFFVGETAVAAVVACLALLLWVTLASHPTAGLGRAGSLALGALMLLAAWTLVSALWADTAARPIYEFDRTLLYLATFALIAARPGGSWTARWLVRGTAVAALAICVAGLATHLLPETFAPAVGDPATDRLTWPLGYWNAMGLMAAIGLVLCVHLTSDLREHAVTRVLAAAATPALAAALYLTLSRGSFLAALVGLALLLVLGRSRGLAGGLAAAVPAVALAIAAAAGPAALTEGYDHTAAATVQAGRELADQLGLLSAAAALVRVVTLLVDRRLGAARLAPWSTRWRVLAAAVVTATAVALTLASGAPAWLSDQWSEFRNTTSVATEGGGRLLEASPNGRIESWEVAWHSWRAEPLHGIGAGTFAHEWAERRPLGFAEQDAHSLFLEVMAELGLVGLLLLAVFLVCPLAAAFRRRRRERALWSAVLAVGAMWMVRAAVDWDWEMAALTLPVVALLASACSREVPRTAGRFARARLPRLVGGLAILLIALTPVRVAASQRSIEQALDAFRAGDCATTIDRALSAQAAFGARPDSYELIGYCDARLGRTDLAVRMLLAASRRDPRSWELQYGLALARGRGGEDPRPALRAALERNPREPLVRDALERMKGSSPRVWRREAGASPLVLPTLTQRPGEVDGESSEP